MTRAAIARSKSPWPAAAWIMVAMLLLAGGVAVTGEILSRSVVLDAVSLWPIGALAVVAAVAVLPFRRRRHRLLALPPLLVVTWLVISVALHLAAWEELPSSAVVLEGPSSEGIGVADLHVSMEGGTLTVRRGSGPAYLLTPLRSGGDAGAPTVAEAGGEGRLRTVIGERTDSFWYRFAGWDIGLSPDLTWELSLAGPEVAADLTGLAVRELAGAGGGTIALGAPPGAGGRVILDGSFQLVLPSGVPATLEGMATVPSSWEATGTGFRAPGEGRGWTVIVASGGTVEVRTP